MNANNYLLYDETTKLGCALLQLALQTTEHYLTDFVYDLITLAHAGENGTVPDRFIFLTRESGTELGLPTYKNYQDFSDYASNYVNERIFHYMFCPQVPEDYHFYMVDIVKYKKLYSHWLNTEDLYREGTFWGDTNCIHLLSGEEVLKLREEYKQERPEIYEELMRG